MALFKAIDLAMKAMMKIRALLPQLRFSQAVLASALVAMTSAFVSLNAQAETPQLAALPLKIGRENQKTITPRPEFSRSPSAILSLNKGDVLARLKQLQSRQLQTTREIEDQIKSRLRDSASIRLKDGAIADKKASEITAQIAELEKKRAEATARQLFVDRLILAVDARWSGGNLQKFIEFQLLDMATTDLLNPQEGSSIWKFLVFASIAVREIPERNESPISILENYMDFASVLNPKPPAEYSNSRHYTDGSASYTSRAADRSQLGDYLEDRMKELRPLPPGPQSTPHVTQPAKADIEIRLRPANPAIIDESIEIEPEPTPTPEPSITF